jgi:hypothetical protein
MWVEKQFTDVPQDETRKIVHDNAATVFGFTV